MNKVTGFLTPTLVAVIGLAELTGDMHMLQVSSGITSFVASTNVGAITVHGKSDRLNVLARVKQDGDRLLLQDIDARVDAKTLSTGMGIRDQHMREKIFTAQDGSVPELRFEAPSASCPSPIAGKNAACNITGTFFLRGEGKPLQMALNVKQEGKQNATYRVTGESTLQLTDYGIQPPSQLGIRVSNQVKVKVEFVTTEHSATEAGR